MKRKRGGREEESEYVRERERGVLKGEEMKEERERVSLSREKRSANSSQIFAQNFPPFSRSLALLPPRSRAARRAGVVENMWSKSKREKGMEGRLESCFLQWLTQRPNTAWGEMGEGLLLWYVAQFERFHASVIAMLRPVSSHLLYTFSAQTLDS